MTSRYCENMGSGALKYDCPGKYTIWLWVTSMQIPLQTNVLYSSFITTRWTCYRKPVATFELQITFGIFKS